MAFYVSLNIFLVKHIFQILRALVQLLQRLHAGCVNGYNFDNLLVSLSFGINYRTVHLKMIITGWIEMFNISNRLRHSNPEAFISVDSGRESLHSVFNIDKCNCFSYLHWRW